MKKQITKSKQNAKTSTKIDKINILKKKPIDNKKNIYNKPLQSNLHSSKFNENLKKQTKSKQNVKTSTKIDKTNIFKEKPNKTLKNKKEELRYYQQITKRSKNPKEILKRSLIFPSPKLKKKYKFKNPKGIHFQELFLNTKDGKRINALFHKGKIDKTILFFSANAMTLKDTITISPFFEILDCNLMFIDYRGYGKSNGKPNEKGLYLDAQAAYDFLIKQQNIKPENIAVGGLSLGTGVAIDLATKNKVNSIFLIAPYSSIKNYLQKSIKWIYGKNNVFDSKEKIKKINVPTIILAGSRDYMFNFKNHAKILSDNCKVKKLESYKIENYGHNDILSSFTTKFLLLQFLKKQFSIKLKIKTRKNLIFTKYK